MLVTMINGGDWHLPAAGRTRAAVGRAGVDVELVTPAEAPPTPGLIAAFRRELRRRAMPRAVDDRYGGFTTDYTDDPFRLIRGLRQKLMGDVVHLFDVDGGFDPETDGFLDWYTAIPLLMKHVPIVWTMTDMTPFTGGCHTDAGCGRFVEHCGCCPALGSTKKPDQSSRAIDRKIRALACRVDTGFVVVTPTQWLAAKSQASRLFGRFEHRVIGPAVDTAVFRPSGREATRAKLNASGPVVFIAPDTPSAARRMEAVIARFPTAKFYSVGPVKISGPGVVNIGWGRNDGEIAEHLPAADLALVDAGPAVAINFAAEAMTSGVAVVGVDDFGLAELIEDGVTGRLVRGSDPAEWIAAVSSLLADEPMRRSMAGTARGRAEQLFDPGGHGRTYAELYRHALAKLAVG